MDQSLATQLQTTLNTVPAFTWYSLPSGTLTFVNHRYADYLGLASDHPLRFGVETGVAWDTHLQLLHPDDHESSRQVGETILRTGAGQTAFRVRDASGVYRWFLSRVEPFRASDGTLLCFMGINLDIEERKQAEFYLAEAQRLAHAGSWVFNAAGFQHWSPELLAIHGMDPHRPPPSLAEYMALVHPEDRESVAQDIQTMLAERRGLDFTKRIIRSDGSIRHIRCVGSLATNGGMVQEFIGTGIDVTEQEELTKALRKSEGELRQVLDLAPQVILVVGPQRERLYANRVALTYYGVSLDEWRQRTHRAEVHPDDADRVQTDIDPSLKSGTAYQLEMRLRGGDGAYRWFLVRYNALQDDQGQIVRWYIAATDIEDRKRDEQTLQQENVALREEIDKTSMFEEIVGRSPALTAVLSQVSKVASSDSTVLISGETGTGKELVARAIHRRSPRASRSFVAVNCAAIPRDLIASELFGHEKGAFTGAIQRHLGRFELAHGGTIFLDEVGELSPDIQVALLRVLQEREFERVGGRERIQVDVRVIAATNRDLSAAVTDGIFRQDLFYRLNVFPVHMPALRERREDIPVLVEYFIGRYARRTGKTFRRMAKRTLDRLQSYPWPGNVRELQNVIERSVIVSDTDELTVDESWLPMTPAVKKRLGLSSALAAHEKAIVEDALRATDGRVFGPKGAAARLGIPRSTLEARIRMLKINKSRFRTKGPKHS
jgi:formate hydrogenlyase transcriptional activator